MRLEDMQALLPATVQEMIATIGLTPTMKLVAEYGGTTIKPPKGQDNNREGAARFEELAEEIGHDNAQMLIKAYGGEDVYIPKCEKALRRLRNLHICADYDLLCRELGGEGAVMKLARKYKLSDKQVWIVLKRTDTSVPGANPAQRGLFDD